MCEKIYFAKKIIIFLLCSQYDPKQNNPRPGAKDDYGAVSFTQQIWNRGVHPVTIRKILSDTRGILSFLMHFMEAHSFFGQYGLLSFTFPF